LRKPAVDTGAPRPSGKRRMSVARNAGDEGGGAALAAARRAGCQKCAALLYW
jgi:hypothetical protein